MKRNVSTRRPTQASRRQPEPSRRSGQSQDPALATTRPAEPSSSSWFGGLDDTLASTPELPSQGPLPERRGKGSARTQPPGQPWWRSRVNDSAPVAGGSALGRLYRAFLAARGALSVLLVGGVLGAYWLERSVPLPVVAMSLVYAALTLGWWWWPVQRAAFDQGRQSLSPRQALGTIGVDLGSFAVLSFMAPGFNVNSAALMALPVLMAAVLLPRYLAVATAAAATLILLSGTVLESLLRGNMASSISAAGLTGFGLFSVALLVSELTARLAKEQSSARSHQEQARQQAQLNRLVIEEMSEGVLVVDRQGRVRSANPSARQLLSAHGQTPMPPFQLRGVPAWAALVKAIENAFNTPPRPHDTYDLNLHFDDQSKRALRMRVKFTRGRSGQHVDDLCVLFIEDQRAVHSRARQDKLAAMGRMTAGIAHEVRNPLAAIAQANALMAEDATTPSQARLTTMVADNVDRLKRIVDDVLTVAPGMRQESPAIDIDRMLRTVVEEWRQLHADEPVAQGVRLLCDGLPPRELGQPALVYFEPEHLRRVLVNLLDNALRHGGGTPSSIEVSAQVLRAFEQPSQVMVSVFSDGPVIDTDTERSLFEPFFSTRSRGTGLGLYICRELCERHGAAIDFRPHPPTNKSRNEFYLLLAMAEPMPPMA
jgi:two-component system sensor histidine kinase PilS (NtrC family)